MDYYPEPPSQPSEHSPSPSTPAKRRPWLPLKHVTGLVMVGVFIVAGTTGSVWFIDHRDGQLVAEAAELDVDIFEELGAATATGDREAFVSWGDGEGAEQLGRLWDETKKIGWESGEIGGLYGTCESEAGGELDLEHACLGFRVSLGFDNERLGELELADPESGTLLWQYFEYDLEIETLDPEHENSSQRIVSMTPRTPMPWDDPDGVAVAKADNVVVFGYADEAQLVEASLADAQSAAGQLLDSALAQREGASVAGFTAFVTEQRERYTEGAFADDPGADDFVRSSAGLAKQFGTAGLPTAGLEKRGEEAPQFAFNGGSLVFLSGEAVEDGTLRAIAHEFAHVLHNAYVPAGDILEDVGGETAITAVKEGYARMVEEKIASPGDGRWITLRPEVLDAVENGDIASLTSAEAFDNPDTANLAYDVAGSFFMYASESGGDIGELVVDPGSGSLPFWLWVDDPERPELSTKGWRAWAAAK